MLVLIAAPFVGELAPWLAEPAPVSVPSGVRCAVLVAGRPAEDDGSLHPGQRQRVEVGVAAFLEQGCERLVVSGGAVRNAHVEAEVMGAYALELGVPESALVAEGRARNSWENVGCSAPHLASADVVLVASDALHVHRVKRYLCRQQPGRCAQVVAVGVHRPFARFPWEGFFTLYEGLAWLRGLTLHADPRNDAPICPAAGVTTSR